MTIPIRLAVPFRVPFYAPFYAAQTTGAFERHGLAVTMEVRGSGQAIVDALFAGEADVAWGGPARVMHERDADAGSPLRCFGSVVKRDPFLLVGRKPRPDFALADLEQLLLGSVSEVPTPWLCLADDLTRSGIDPTRIRRVTDRTMAQNAEALSVGDIDVAQLFEPYASQLEARGAGAVWASAAARGDTAYTSFISTEPLIEKHRAGFQALIRAMAETLTWVRTQGPRALCDAVEARYDDIPRDLLLRCVTRYHELGIWSADPHISRDSFERLAQALLSAGSVSRLPVYEECVDARIVEEALSQ